ncbi:DUF1257 domain-containing protein [Streptomyces sp. SBT349]|uniref:DUF1257 domain-containing protein n=1 Tax=Streptomyces sp. SBT349 TaxID=1580539 RepID=UPI00066E1C53|nr:DUF1257 domain-containing protein [Streptomyces sp. SBT349]
MSHFTRVRTVLRDPGLLAAALATAGFEAVETHETPQTLYGYRGDARPERAEIIVRRRHVGRASNDIGFRRSADGTFEAIISEYDRARYGPAWLARVARAYGHAAALRYAEDHGYEVASDTVERDGERRLILRRYT